MKKCLFCILLMICPFTLFSQAPEGMNYQAIVRCASGSPIINQSVSFRFNILKASQAGVSVYMEKHFVNTDQFGGVGLVIGDGTDKTGDFASIDWGGDIYFINTGIDTTGGTFFADMGTSQLLSVPYSLHAKTAANVFSGNYNDLTNKPVTDGSETKVKAGVNVTVTGIGTIANPYIINAKSHVAAGSNIVVSGSGTSVDPYIIQERVHYVGESFGGGIVFHVYDNGRHGLIAARTDQDIAVEWHNGTNRYTNTTGDGVRAGEMNTSLIIALQTNDNPTGNFAAKVCADYSVTIDGESYGDWYLPSKLELTYLYMNKDVVGNFQNNYYWSSTEFSSISAWALNFVSGSFLNLNKSIPYAVRAVRAF